MLSRRVTLLYDRSVRGAGGLCVMDEVQTGFGRGGEYFWMFESQGTQQLHAHTMLWG